MWNNNADNHGDIGQQIQSGYSTLSQRAKAYIQKEWINPFYVEALGGKSNLPSRDCNHSTKAALPSALNKQVAQRTILSHPEEYVVNEKTNGTRLWLLVVQTSRGFIALFINRAGQMWLAPKFRFGKGTLEGGNNRIVSLLFDGEFMTSHLREATTATSVTIPMHEQKTVDSPNYGPSNDQVAPYDPSSPALEEVGCGYDPSSPALFHPPVTPPSRPYSPSQTPMSFDEQVASEENILSTTTNLLKYPSEFSKCTSHAKHEYIIFDMIGANFSSELFLGTSYLSRIEQCAKIAPKLSSQCVDFVVKKNWQELDHFFAADNEIRSQSTLSDGWIFVHKLAPPFKRADNSSLVSNSEAWLKYKEENTIDFWLKTTWVSPDVYFMSLEDSPSSSCPISWYCDRKNVVLFNVHLLYTTVSSSIAEHSNRAAWLRYLPTQAHPGSTTSLQGILPVSLPSNCIIEFKIDGHTAAAAVAAHRSSCRTCFHCIGEDTICLDIVPSFRRTDKSKANKIDLVIQAISEFLNPSISMSTIAQVLRKRH